MRLTPRPLQHVSLARLPVFIFFAAEVILQFASKSVCRMPFSVVLSWVSKPQRFVTPVARRDPGLWLDEEAM